MDDLTVESLMASITDIEEKAGTNEIARTGRCAMNRETWDDLKQKYPPNPNDPPGSPLFGVKVFIDWRLPTGWITPADEQGRAILRFEGKATPWKARFPSSAEGPAYVSVRLVTDTGS